MESCYMVVGTIFYLFTFCFNFGATTNTCLCNYGSQQNMYSVPDERASVVDILDSAGCVTVFTTLPDRQFYSVLHGDQIAYVLKSSIVHVQNCTTSFTVSLPSTTTTLTTTATTTPAAITSKPTTTTVTPNPTSPSLGCRDGYTPVGQYCYLCRHGRMSWASAQHLCQSHGGHLVHIDSQQKQDELSAYLRDYVHGDTHWWIGLNEISGHWIWRDPETSHDLPVQYTHWDDGEPDDGGQYCGLMTLDGDYYWKDRTCSDHYSLICESAPQAIGSATNNPLQTSGICENGWESFGGQCYRFSTHALSWHHAQDVCKNNGGHLAVVNSHEIQNYLHHSLQDIVHSHHSVFWIGATDAQDEGHWMWNSGQSFMPMNYTAWFDGEPNNSDQGQDCATIVTYFGFRWNDDACYEDHNFICEKTSHSPAVLVG